jgi:hypothetical protein
MRGSAQNDRSRHAILPKITKNRADFSRAAFALARAI